MHAATLDNPSLVQRINALAPDDPWRRQKAFRVYLENLLLAEFGADLIGGHDFTPFVELVLQRMENLPELARSMDEAGAMLLAQCRAYPSNA